MNENKECTDDVVLEVNNLIWMHGKGSMTLEDAQGLALTFLRLLEGCDDDFNEWWDQQGPGVSAHAQRIPATAKANYYIAEKAWNAARKADSQVPSIL